MTTKEFIQKYNGKSVDWDGAYGGQCVDLFRQYAHEVLKFPQAKSVVGAADFWANYDTDPILNQNYEKIPNSEKFIPKERDIAVWNKRMGGGYGHIGVCTGKGDLNTFESFDQNWSKLSYCELVTHTYSSFYGVLRPKGQTLNNTDELDKLRKIVTELEQEVEQKNEHIGNYVAQVEGKNEEIKYLNIELTEERGARKLDLQRIATKLASTDDIVEILKEIEKLVVAEEGLVKCLDAKRECGEKYAQKATEYAKILETASLLSGIPVASEKGLERAMKAYANMHAKLPPSQLEDFSFIIKLFGYMMYSRKETNGVV